MKRIFVIVMVLIMFIFAITSKAYGDDCLVGRTPDGVYPIESSEIIMESEHIYVNVEKQTATCSFQFKNTGPARDITMGFPAEKKSTNENTMPDNLRILNFETTVDGGKIPVKLEKNIRPEGMKIKSKEEYVSWYTFVIHFDSGETKNIYNAYDFVSTFYSNGDTLTGYIIDTGAYWKGKIGYAKVYFDMGNIKPYMIQEISPNMNYRFDGTNLMWEYSNFEPEENLRIMYNTLHFSNEFLNSMDDTTKENIRKEVENFNNIDKRIKEHDVQGLESFYKLAVKDNRLPLAEYIRENMGDSKAKNIRFPVIGLIVTILAAAALFHKIEKRKLKFRVPEEQAHGKNNKETR